MKPSLNHIHFRCHNQVETAQWFIANLGGEDAGQGDIAGWPVYRVNLAGVIITFSPAKEGQVVEENSGQPRYGMYQLGLEVDSLAETQAELQAKGLAFKAGPIEIREGLKVAFLDGPEDIEIELMEVK